MAEMSSYPQGRPSWVDLATPDADAARGFYGALFGWAFEVGPPETGGYTICRVQERSVAGLMAHQPDQAGMPAAWTTYLAVDDANDAEKRITEAGGTVLMAPMDVMTEGRMLLAQDPSGAVFGCWQPRNHTGAQLVGEPATMVWHELLSRDLEAAREFYATVFGYDLETIDAGGTPYIVCSIGGEQVAGLMAMPEAVPAEAPSNWAVYFGVADTDDALARLQSLGGTLLMGPEDSPYGRWAVVQDPQGAVFSLITAG